VSALTERDFNNILIIKPSSLGDVVRSLPILAGLSHRYRHARISWLVRPDCATVLRNQPNLHEIIEFDRHRYGRILRHPGAAWQFVRFCADLDRHRFDLVLDLQGLFRSGFLALCTGADVRLGFAHARELAPCFYTHRITASPGREHIVESLWRFADVLGFGDTERRFDIPLDHTAQATAAKLLPHRQYTVLIIGGTSAAKRWPLQYFAKLVDTIDDRYDIPTILLGSGDDEISLARQVAQTAHGRLVSLVGKTSLSEAIEIIRNARLVVGNDSGPLHIAAALGTPLVGLYGPTDPAVVGPWGQTDGIVEAGAETPRTERYSRKPQHAMTNITTEQVIEKVRTKLVLC